MNLYIFLSLNFTSKCIRLYNINNISFKNELLIWNNKNLNVILQHDFK